MLQTVSWLNVWMAVSREKKNVNILEKFDSGVQHSNSLRTFAVICQNFGINKTSKHLTFEKWGHETKMRTRLIGQKCSFIKWVHLVPIRQPRIHILYKILKKWKSILLNLFNNITFQKRILDLIRLSEKVFIDGEHVSKLIEKYLTNSIVGYLHSQVALKIGRCVHQVGYSIPLFNFGIFMKHTCTKFWIFFEFFQNYKRYRNSFFCIWYTNLCVWR